MQLEMAANTVMSSRLGWILSFLFLENFDDVTQPTMSENFSRDFHQILSVKFFFCHVYPVVVGSYVKSNF